MLSLDNPALSVPKRPQNEFGSRGWAIAFEAWRGSASPKCLLSLFHQTPARPP